MKPDVASNITLYHWSRFLRSLTFWQAFWFLYFQGVLSGAVATLIGLPFLALQVAPPL